MTRDEQLKAAAAYRRARMSWDDIAKLVGGRRETIRTALKKEGRDDGWGRDSLIKRDGGLKPDRAK